MSTIALPTVASNATQHNSFSVANGNSTAIANRRTNSVEALVEDLASAVRSAVRDIRRVNDNTRTLALNARIEAARAGQNGAAFGVVASEMQQLSSTTAAVADLLASATNAKIANLLSLIGNNIRGTRLSDLALTNIDLIDRCLYERTCDVRWWATDSSLTDALKSKTAQAFNYASQRLSIILDAYTVYYDLVLCDVHGKIVANGRPDQFNSIGQSVADCQWFSSALATRRGDQFGFQSAHPSTLVNRQPSLAYSCTVRQNGQVDGEVLGVLGVLFNWSSLADPILQGLPIPAEELAHTECLIVDQNRHVLASSSGYAEQALLHLPDFSKVLAEDKGFFMADYQGRKCCIAHARAPGFETYSTGWYSIIVQPC
jgi:hypothetical protein